MTHITHTWLVLILLLTPALIMILVIFAVAHKREKRREAIFNRLPRFWELEVKRTYNWSSLEIAYAKDVLNGNVVDDYVLDSLEKLYSND